MSAPATRFRGGLARALVRLYPEAWRERYGREMEALLEDDPPGFGGLASLVRGAAEAHVRPRRCWAGGASPTDRMRLSIGAMFACWVALSVLGVGFAKATEDLPFARAADRHALLWAAHAATLAGAALGALAVAVGGLPLVWQALERARVTRDRRLAALLATPALAVGCFAAVTLALFVVSPSKGSGFPASYVLEILVPFAVAGLVCAGVCVWAPRAVLARMRPSVPSLRRAALAGRGLAVAMCLVAAGMAVYAPVLWIDGGALAAGPTGPFGAPTGAMLVAEALAAVLVAELGVVAGGRAWRAASQRP